MAGPCTPCHHPVRIRFLDDATFRKEVTDSEAPDAEEREEIKSEQAVLRAVGLLSGEVDLLAAGKELAGEGIDGLYSPEDEERTSGEIAAYTAAAEADADIGMLSLLVMLGERIDFGVAWPAVQGWAGDSIVAFERAGSTCVRGDVVFDSPPQAERFDRALAEWAAGRPATRPRNDRSVLFESCDPGAAAAGGRAEGHVSGIEGLALREGLIAGMQEEGLSPKVAACAVDGLLGQLRADRVAGMIARDAGPGAPNPETKLEVQRALAQVVPGCR